MSFVSKAGLKVEALLRPALQKIILELDRIVGTGVSSGGFVKAKTRRTARFSSELLELKIDQAAMQGSPERLEILIKEAVNAALKKENELVEKMLDTVERGGPPIKIKSRSKNQ